MTEDRTQAVMVEMNTTPLIDVMLVLLIMFIITIPVQSHAVKLDLPGEAPEITVLEPLRNKVVITAEDRILWNGETVGRTQLRTLFDLTLEMDMEPELHLQPEADARYVLVDEVLADAGRAGVTKLGFVGNEGYARAF
ncbi:ExbD/TolR family protein [Sphingomicrobium aestuariivivum]|uniref:ExbD/TolR family protein n=1 Tax=Sphingomicrobium aestuariivivum TaxID=1582356 RepID=UPI001FD6E7A1|nr:biopolymer transporter ExbD [Sphingomicrobium aestuariivivum]MCJ8191853.1 biopolymer transporter ExbD [Sphingomicrobium aestuariivivum]